MATSTTELDHLDTARNRLPIPAGRSKAFGEGWLARENGVMTNPYSGSPSTQPVEYDEWHFGDAERAKIGFDYSHRIGSGTRIGPFQY